MLLIPASGSNSELGPQRKRHKVKIMALTFPSWTLYANGYCMLMRGIGEGCVPLALEVLSCIREVCTLIGIIQEG